jgi:accessory secretory protein Asp2
LNIRTIQPLRDHGIEEPARLAVFNHRTSKFDLLHEIDAGGLFVISTEHLSTHLDYSYKLQVKRDGRWIDQSKYERLACERITPHGIKYLHYPEMNSRHLVVVFQAINTTPGYNYIKTLTGTAAHRLYIKDDYGNDEATRSSYYLGPNRTDSIAIATQDLIREFAANLGVDRRNCIFAGSSKGGFAALYHGFKFNAGSILPGGPQVLLGDFLASRSENSVHPPILNYLSGGTDPSCAEWANRILFRCIEEATPPFPRIKLHVGKGEPHYKNHAAPLMRFLHARGINISVDLGDYDSHEELASHYPKFLRTEVEALIRDDDL